MGTQPTGRGGDRGGDGRLPTGQLEEQLQRLVGALAERAMGSVSQRIDAATERFTNYLQDHGPVRGAAVLRGATETLKGASPVKAVASGVGTGLRGVKEKVKEKVKGTVGGTSHQESTKLKLTNIVEEIDVGVPLRVAYNQWTQFEKFPSFMKKVEYVEQKSDEKLAWKAHVFLSRREWESTIIEQIPDQRIVWRSRGDHGYVDGAVTFHELGPRLTRILLVLEYNPKGLVERTGNLWRAQGRRARLELKHFQRHVMAHAILHPEKIEGWRGEIRDSQVTRDHEESLEEERQREEERNGQSTQEKDTGRPSEEEPEEEPEEDEE